MQFKNSKSFLYVCQIIFVHLIQAFFSFWLFIINYSAVVSFYRINSLRLLSKPSVAHLICMKSVLRIVASFLCLLSICITHQIITDSSALQGHLNMNQNYFDLMRTPNALIGRCYINRL